MSIPRFLRVVGLTALVVAAASPALGQAPRSGGSITLRLREDLPLRQIHLPYLFTPEFDQAAIDELSRRLEGQI